MSVAVAGRMRFARALRWPSFALLWSGQTISGLGDGAYYTALAWEVAVLTGSATAMSVVLIAAAIPRIVFVLVGGVVADRLPRRLVLLWSDGGRAVATLAIAALGWAHLTQLWHLVALSLLFGFADAFFMPSYQSLPPQLVPTDDLPSANALTGLSRSLSVLIGPAIGATLVAVSSPAAAFAFDGLTFVVSAVCLAAMRLPAKATFAATGEQSPTSTPSAVSDTSPGPNGSTVSAMDRGGERFDSAPGMFVSPEADGRLAGATALAIGAPAVMAGETPDVLTVEAPIVAQAPADPETGAASKRRGVGGVLADVREGLGYVARSPWLWVTITIAALLNVGIAPIQVAAPKLIHDVWGEGVWLLAALTSANAVGSILGTLAMGQAGRLRRRGIIAYSGLLASCVAALALGLPLQRLGATYLPVAVCVVGFALGAGFGVFEVIWTTVMQELVPAETLGRVISVDWLGSLCLTPIGLALAGALADRVGPSVTFLVGGGLNVALVLVGFAVRGVRRLD